VRAVRGHPIAYLRGLVERARAGTFVAEHAGGIAAARRRELDAARASAAAVEAERRFAAERNTPEYHAKIEKRREDIRRFLERSRRGNSAGSEE